MSKSIVETSGVVTAASPDVTVTSVSLSTPHLSSLFANFMVGDTGNTMKLQKSFALFNSNINEVCNSYEYVSPAITLIPTIYVRVSSVSVTEDGNYAASFVATAQGNEYSLPRFKVSDGVALPDLTLGLYAGDFLLAVTTFNYEVYEHLAAGSRVDIKWTLQLVNSNETKEKVNAASN